MRKTFAILSFLIFSSTICLADRCPKCHGGGRVKTQYGVSSYGIDSKRFRCPNCGKMISSGTTHYDDCDLCGGTGSVSSGSSSSSHSSNFDFNADLLINLSPDEYNALQENIRFLAGRTEYIECGTCNGTGKCNQCGGLFNTNFDDPNRCLFCDGTGYCIVCKGRKTIGTRIVKPTEEEKEKILANIKSLTSLAEKRNQEKFNTIPTQNPNSIMEPDTIEIDDDEDIEDYGDGIPYTYILIGIGIVAVLIWFIKDK